MFVALTLATPNAEAFELRRTEDGGTVAWPEMPVVYEWSEMGAVDGAETAAHHAFEEWQKVETAEIRFESGPDAQAPALVPDGHNQVWFETAWPWDDELLAMASTWADESGNVVAFDIQIHAGAAWSTHGKPEGYDLQAALTHEIGHVLGLEHSGIDDAVMFASQGEGDLAKRKLHPDDQAAVALLYPGDDGSETDGIPLQASCSTVSRSLSCWSAMWLFLPLIARRRAGVSA